MTTRSTLDPDTFTFPRRQREDPYTEPNWNADHRRASCVGWYTELERLEGILAWQRARRYVPEHAPSDFRARRDACRPYEARIRDLQARIDRAQNR